MNRPPDLWLPPPIQHLHVGDTLVAQTKKRGWNSPSLSPPCPQVSPRAESDAPSAQVAQSLGVGLKASFPLVFLCKWALSVSHAFHSCCRQILGSPLSPRPPFHHPPSPQPSHSRQGKRRIPGSASPVVPTALTAALWPAACEAPVPPVACGHAHLCTDHLLSPRKLNPIGTRLLLVPHHFVTRGCLQTHALSTGRPWGSGRVTNLVHLCPGWPHCPHCAVGLASPASCSAMLHPSGPQPHMHLRSAPSLP